LLCPAGQILPLTGSPDETPTGDNYRNGFPRYVALLSGS